MKKTHSIFYHCIGRENKKHHWKYNKKICIKDVSPIVSKVLQDQHLAKTKHNNSWQKRKW
jgi:hypothetical protein